MPGDVCLLSWAFVLLSEWRRVNHNTVINWLKQVATALPDAPDYQEIPEIAQVDELQTFVTQKKQIVAMDRRQ